jgi:hypothetical protein
MAIAKVIVNGATKMDATTATASAEDIIAPKTAMLANGIVTTGTGTGGSGDGGYVAADWLDLSKPVGNIVSSMQPTGRYNVSSILIGRTKIDNIFLTEATYIGDSMLASCSVKKLVAPKVGIIYTSGVSRCSKLTAVDIMGTEIQQSAFIVCSALNVIVLRNTSPCALGNITALNNTPFGSSGSGGTLYVPQALIASYQEATNWSVILGYDNNNIQAIEGSIYETQYVDGTPIAA